MSLSLSLSLSLSAVKVKVKVKVKSQEASTLAIFLALATGSTENRGLLVAQALLQVTAKLARQANFITFLGKCSGLQHTALLDKLDTRKESWPIFTHSTGLLRPGYLCLLHAAVQQSRHPADSRFPRS